MKLFIVEGIPGSGKSTMARFIALQSERNGARTTLYHESAYPHPLLAQTEEDRPEVWMDTYLSNWKRFLERYRDSEETVVAEAVLFQQPILRLLHLDLDRDEIVEFIGRISQLLHETDCRLVYLHQRDPDIGIDRLLAARGGEEWLLETYRKYEQEPYYRNRGQTGPELHLDFLREYARLAGAAVGESPLRTLAIDNTDWDWEASRHHLVSEFGWRYRPDPVVPTAQLEKYAGVYRNEAMKLDLVIERRGDALFIFDRERLRPKGGECFYLDNISLVARFVFGASGETERVVIEEKDLVGNRSDEGTAFMKIDRS